MATYTSKELRHAYMADQVRVRIALQIKALRNQPERQWSQAELGRRTGQPASVIADIENPDYSELTLQALLDIAKALDLPLYVDLLEWKDWFAHMRDFSPSALQRSCTQP